METESEQSEQASDSNSKEILPQKPVIEDFSGSPHLALRYNEDVWKATHLNPPLPRTNHNVADTHETLASSSFSRGNTFPGVPSGSNDNQKSHFTPTALERLRDPTSQFPFVRFPSNSPLLFPEESNRPTFSVQSLADLQEKVSALKSTASSLPQSSNPSAEEVSQHASVAASVAVLISQVAALASSLLPAQHINPSLTNFLSQPMFSGQLASTNLHLPPGQSEFQPKAESSGQENPRDKSKEEEEEEEEEQQSDQNVAPNEGEKGGIQGPNGGETAPSGPNPTSTSTPTHTPTPTRPPGEVGEGGPVVGRVMRVIGGEEVEVVEVEPWEVLQEHSHFCEECGKGFKREANLRMHRRGHGDHFKSMQALAASQRERDARETQKRRRYSCPSPGCRRNVLHPQFLPLKTLLCVKNHYRRSHCPRVLTCTRCHLKRFSVPADLKTHEKHCGQDTWHCVCGTSFSRKDKLLGHLSLFEGHFPLSLAQLQGQPGSATNEGVTGTNASGEEEEDSSSESAGEQ